MSDRSALHDYISTSLLRTADYTALAASGNARDTNNMLLTRYCLNAAGYVPSAYLLMALCVADTAEKFSDIINDKITLKKPLDERAFAVIFSRIRQPDYYAQLAGKAYDLGLTVVPLTPGSENMLASHWEAARSEKEEAAPVGASSLPCENPDDLAASVRLALAELENVPGTFESPFIALHQARPPVITAALLEESALEFAIFARHETALRKKLQEKGLSLTSPRIGADAEALIWGRLSTVKPLSQRVLRK